MRTSFELLDEDYVACRERIVEHFLAWAREQNRVTDPYIARVFCDYRQRYRDGQIARWRVADLCDLLLGWFPQQITLDAEHLDVVISTMAAWLDYLEAHGLRDPRGEPLTQLHKTLNALRADYMSAMTDSARYGIAKYWNRVMSEHGVSLADHDAVEQFFEDVQGGHIVVDEIDITSAVAASARHVDGTIRIPNRNPVVLADPTELALAADLSRVATMLRDFTAWVGDKGRLLTKTGRLRMADARELVTLLDTGDQLHEVYGERVFTKRSSAELRTLSSIFGWAKQAGLVRVQRGRLVTVKRNQALLTDPLKLWERAFTAFTGMVDVVLPNHRFRSMFSETFQDLVPEMLTALYGAMDPTPLPMLRESVWMAASVPYDMSGATTEQIDLWRQFLEIDLDMTIEQLIDLGALHRDEHDRIALTALGTWALNQELRRTGRDAPVVGDLRELTGVGVLTVILDHYPPGLAAPELDRWLECRNRDAAVGELLAAVRLAPFSDRRATMIAILVNSLPEGNRVLRGLLADPVLAPAAIAYATSTGCLELDDLDERQAASGLTESLSIMLAVGGREQLRAAIADASVQEFSAMRQAVARSEHPDAPEVLRALSAVGAASHTARTHGRRPPHHRPRRYH